MDKIRLFLISDNIYDSRVPTLHHLALSQLNIKLSYELIIPYLYATSGER